VDLHVDFTGFNAYESDGGDVRDAHVSTIARLLMALI
jgi:hypothetical protein